MGAFQFRDRDRATGTRTGPADTSRTVLARVGRLRTPDESEGDEMNEVRPTDMSEPLETSDEPIGIVIALGERIEESTRFSAYVWSKQPESPVPDALAAA